MLIEGVITNFTAEFVSVRTPDKKFISIPTPNITQIEHSSAVRAKRGDKQTILSEEFEGLTVKIWCKEK